MASGSLVGCSQNERSYMSGLIREGEEHAIFSYHFADGISGSADLLGNNNGEVSLTELFSYAYQKTVKSAEEISQRQSPENVWIGA